MLSNSKTWKSRLRHSGPRKFANPFFRAPQREESDLIKTAMLRLDSVFKRRKMNARIVMVIHDALWVEALQEEAAEVKHLMRLMIVKPLRAHYTRG
ncbi:MAG: DNA polymerase [Desulfomonilaceae bacterium]